MVARTDMARSPFSAWLRPALMFRLRAQAQQVALQGPHRRSILPLRLLKAAWTIRRSVKIGAQWEWYQKEEEERTVNSSATWGKNDTWKWSGISIGFGGPKVWHKRNMKTNLKRAQNMTQRDTSEGRLTHFANHIPLSQPRSLLSMRSQTGSFDGFINKAIPPLSQPHLLLSP